MTEFGPIEIHPPKHNQWGINDEYNEKLNPRLPTLPFFLVIIGPRNSGKTNFMRNIMSKDPGMYGAVFKPNNVILYKPTLLDDRSLDELKITHQFDDTTDLNGIIAKLYQQLAENRDDDNLLPVLMLLDDITLDLRAWSILTPLGVKGRHKGLNGMFITHKMSSIPRVVRTQLQQYIVFCPHEMSEWEWILETFASKGTKHIWLAALSRAWSKKYNFVFIDYERDINDRFHDGFNLPLFTPREEAEIAAILGGRVTAADLRNNKRKLNLEETPEDLPEIRLDTLKKNEQYPLSESEDEDIKQKPKKKRKK